MLHRELLERLRPVIEVVAGGEQAVDDEQLETRAADRSQSGTVTRVELGGDEAVGAHDPVDRERAGNATSSRSVCPTRPANARIASRSAVDGSQYVATPA